MTPDRIRELARVRLADGSHRPPNAEELSFLIDFEERYGGLWYYVLGGKGMRHGLEGRATLHETDFGVAVPGIFDGDWSWPVDVLTDGRTVMRLGRDTLTRRIDDSLDQRIESHALLAEVVRWPHRIFSFTLPFSPDPRLGADQVNADRLPAPVPEATGTTSCWWFDGEHAVFIRLRAWWRRHKVPGESTFVDSWAVWCFTRDGAELDEAAERYRSAITGAVELDQDSCMLCLRSVEAGEHCTFDTTERRIIPPGPAIKRSLRM